MARIVVIGGGLIGLATAMMIARQGHQVTVLERDPAPPPSAAGEAWDHWERHGVMQFRQPHFLLPAGLRVLEAELPEVVAQLRSAGAVRQHAPDLASGQRAATLSARRPVLEHAMAAAAADWVDVRRGARATGLLSTRRGLVQVTGVLLADRTELAADLVIDAMGRASALPIWLTHIGAGEMTERAEPPGLSYYARYFLAGPRSGRGPLPAYGLTRCDGYSILVIPADAGTWSVTVCAHAGDTALRALRSERNWTRFVGACPAHEPLLAGGQPVGGVLTAGGVPDRVRGLVRHGVPAATGVLSVGDAWACTSPAFGRGVTLGLMHAAVVAEAVTDHVKDPLTLALEWDRLTRERLLPWYQNTVNQASKHAAQLGSGGAAPVPSPGNVKLISGSCGYSSGIGGHAGIPFPVNLAEEVTVAHRRGSRRPRVAETFWHKVQLRRPPEVGPATRFDYDHSVGDRIVTWPNALSAARLAGVPVFLWLVLGPRTATADIIAAALLGAAGVSDWLDGKLARMLNQTSRLGQKLDPFADRLYIAATIIALAVRDIIPWWLFGVILAREAIVTLALFGVLRRRTDYEALSVSFVGKAATLCLMYAFPLLFLGAHGGVAAEVVRVIGWAFAVWGVALYWWAALLYLSEIRDLMRGAAAS